MVEASPMTTAKKTGRVWFFPTLIIGLLVFQIVAALVGVWLAWRSQSAVVEADYYNRAVHWDDYEAKVRASNELGWKYLLQTQEAGAVGNMVTIHLADKEGRDLAGAVIEGTYFHRAHPKEGKNIKFVAKTGGAGIYEGKADFSQSGVWEFRLLAKRGPQEFLMNQSAKIEVGK